MRARNPSIAMIAIGLFVVLGCGGTGGGGGATALPGTLEPNASSGSPSTEPVASEQPPASQVSGEGAAVSVCEFVTADELAGIFKVPAVTTSVLAGPPDNCIVASDTGDPLAAWSLSLAQAKAVFDALTSDPSTVAVSGIGDKAAIVQNTGLLVLKGDVLMVISISGGADLSADEAIEVSKQIGVIAAGRM